MKISVIGSGYVGLVSGTCFAEMGNDVICVDNNPQKLAQLKKAEVPIYEPGLDLLFYRNIAKSRLHFTDDLKSAVLDCEVIMLCLPTPQGEDGSADLKYVYGIAEDIGKILSENGDSDFKIIANKSTVPVGTSAAVTNILKKYNLKNFEVVSNPEFLREGYAVDDFMKPDRIVIGASTELAMEKMKSLYYPFVLKGSTIIEMNPESSEVTKYAANSYLAMRITFMNELANFCEVVGANIDLVRKGMGSDTRIGKRFLYAGIGYGGSCFPKDVNALIKTSKEKGSEMRLLTLVDQVNKDQKQVIVKKILQHFGENIKGMKFAIWGLAFKPNTDDMREAPSVVIIEELLKRGATVTAYDPEAMENAKFYLQERIKYAEDQYKAVEGANALLVLTEWNEFNNPDLEQVKSLLAKPIIFDGRNVFNRRKTKELGFTHYSIGKTPIIQ
ncbi:MAG: UDP-glucose/GDP-mannose dehydrogenase family protein [Ignavibacteriales bacterium]|nr:UDP-glucose/GDP-mannose dehydrogenase family protein [Ignavibacteriales bacterium]MBK7981409.1 UDP-glucose/GDP-mannose dehydrogenase family protein [Ignavibacteriota bacterium]